jgi:hypothetical protein
MEVQVYKIIKAQSQNCWQSAVLKNFFTSRDNNYRHNWEINEPETWQSTMLLGYDLLKLKQNQTLLFDKKQTPLSSVVQFYLPCLNLPNSKLPRSSLENSKLFVTSNGKKVVMITHCLGCLQMRKHTTIFTLRLVSLNSELRRNHKRNLGKKVSTSTSSSSSCK